MPETQYLQGFPRFSFQQQLNLFNSYQVACEYRTEYSSWLDNGCINTMAYEKKAFMVLIDIKVRSVKLKEKEYTHRRYGWYVFANSP